jgi:hypothetical protein
VNSENSSVLKNQDYNQWKGIWKTRSGVVVEILNNQDLNNGNNIMIGRLIKLGLVTVWDKETGNHFDDSSLDLVNNLVLVKIQIPIMIHRSGLTINI